MHESNIVSYLKVKYYKIYDMLTNILLSRTAYLSVIRNEVKMTRGRLLIFCQYMGFSNIISKLSFGFILEQG